MGAGQTRTRPNILQFRDSVEVVSFSSHPRYHQAARVLFLLNLKVSKSRSLSSFCSDQTTHEAGRALGVTILSLTKVLSAKALVVSVTSTAVDCVSELHALMSACGPSSLADPEEAVSTNANEAAQETAERPLYQPLPRKTSTRLVVLYPGHGNDPIRCSLLLVDLDASPHYVAISYTWSEAGDKAEILLDGHRVLIRRNLYNCVRTMRDHSSLMYLWIDALSISQSDLDEKSQQVGMIGRIFSQAYEVRAWLGDHADNSQCLFNDVDTMSRVRQNRLVVLGIWLRKWRHQAIPLFFAALSLTGLI